MITNWDFKTVKDDLIITLPVALPIGAEDATVDVHPGKNNITVNIFGPDQNLLEFHTLQYRPLGASYIIGQDLVLIQFRLAASSAYMPFLAKVRAKL